MTRMPASLLIVPFALMLSACDLLNEEEPPAAPPPGVLTAKVEKQLVRETLEFIGRTVAVNDVSLGAQVSGYLLERHFEEGAEVDLGDLLFTIDPAIYEAQVAAAEGSVAKASAALSKADKDLKRYRILLKKQSVSQQQVDEAESNKLQAAAELKAAEASLLGAKTDLSFTEIRAPIHGRIGRALVSIGNLVGPQSGELARLVELDPMYVNFSISERDLLNVKQRRAREKADQVVERAEVEVELRLPNKEIYDHKGKIDFLDNVVDPKTGSVTVRARFDNPEKLLVPGLFVNAILGTTERETEMMIPQASVQEDQAGNFVLVVDPDDKIERRPITTGRHHEGMLVVREGLEPDERVVVEGIQKVRPGMKVAPKEAELPGYDDLQGEAADKGAAADKSGKAGGAGKSTTETAASGKAEKTESESAGMEASGDSKEATGSDETGTPEKQTEESASPSPEMDKAEN
ncbi:MAG: efflux RND transporter periplasmic adaptor subunit [Gammaproteobacteria bacterium]|nr:efflux RND transporter periplasmic adaptor subunit [Gammaproteobacteria bacterium]